jgi:hypothetical protein
MIRSKTSRFDQSGNHQQLALGHHLSQDMLHNYHVPGLKTWSGKQLFLGVYVTSKERKEERSGELELSTGCHARARSCDADVTTSVISNVNSPMPNYKFISCSRKRSRSAAS